MKGHSRKGNGQEYEGLASKGKLKSGNMGDCLINKRVRGLKLMK